MNASPRAVIARLSILLLAVCALSFGWEATKNSGLKRMSGCVVRVKRAFGGRAGDNREFTIRYRLKGKDYYLVTRRGILDSLGSLRGLQPGDNVPLAVSPNPPHSAVLDTLNGRYEITLCFALLAAVYGIVVFFLGSPEGYHCIKPLDLSASRIFWSTKWQREFPK